MFADSLQLPYPLLSDYPDLEAVRRYGALASNGRYPCRFFFLIDQQGIIRGPWPARGDEVFSSELILKEAQEIVGEAVEVAGEMQDKH